MGYAEYSVGQVVYSKCGHDKGSILVISDIENEFLYLIDGKTRKMDKPKKKKAKHVQKTNYLDEELKRKVENGEYLLDSDFSKAIKRYSSQSEQKK